MPLSIDPSRTIELACALILAVPDGSGAAKMQALNDDF